MIPAAVKIGTARRRVGAAGPGMEGGMGRGATWGKMGALAWLGLAVPLLLAAACTTPADATLPAAAGASSAASVSAATGASPAAAVEPLTVQVLGSFPHDPEAFTQGLVWDAGRLYESTGLEHFSSLREVNPQTGEVLRKVDLDPQVFGEGLAMVGDRLVQITWKNEVAYDWDKATFERRGEFAYEGEGWGLCLDDDRLVMSDGSDTLFFRDPQTFALEGQLRVTLDGVPVHHLNELECVGPDVYANIWLTDDIYRIDKATGKVTATIDARGLLDKADAPGADVLNGIAYKPETDTFLITGKKWPRLFEVRFVRSTAHLPIAVTPGPGRP
jgi:glutamine cyclotransferase